MNTSEYYELVSKAVKRVREMDRSDEESGDAKPEHHWMATMDTVQSALEAAILMDDWDMVADSIVMLMRFTDPIHGEMKILTASAKAKL